MKIKNKYNSTVIICTAIGCIALLEAMALSKGINGVLFSAVIAAIAGLGGWVMPSPLKK